MSKIKLGKLLSIFGWGTLILAIVIVLTGSTYMVLAGILSGIFGILAEKMK